MFLLTYRSSKHETVGVTPSEVYFGRNLRLPLDLLRGIHPGEEGHLTTGNFVSNLRKKLDLIQGNVRQTLKVKSEMIKSAYDQKARSVNFSIGQKSVVL